jgi:methionine aminopeptidase
MELTYTAPSDYSLNNPDTLTKYKTAAQISEKVLAAVSELCVVGEKIVDICEKGDKLIEEELAKVYRGKKILKGERYTTVMQRSGRPRKRKEIDSLHSV